jgi:hypothetical protein
VGGSGTTSIWTSFAAAVSMKLRQMVIACPGERFLATSCRVRWPQRAPGTASDTERASARVVRTLWASTPSVTNSDQLRPQGGRRTLYYAVKRRRDASSFTFSENRERMAQSADSNMELFKARARTTQAGSCSGNVNAL